MRLRNAAPALALLLLSLFLLHDIPVPYSNAAAPSSSAVSIHLVGELAGWNGTNPTITVNQGDTVSMILTSGDISHQFAIDWDHDNAIPTGACLAGDNCSKVFGLGPATIFTFTASFAPGTYTYFCTFHFEMVGSLIIRAAINPPTVAINSVSPNPANTGTPVTLDFSVTSPATVSLLSIDWGDGTVTHPSPTATSDTHSYLTALTTGLGSQTFTINVTATSASGHGSATISEIVNDRPPTLTITSLSPNPGTTGQMVTLNFTASDPDGTVQTTWVDWGDGTVPDLIFNMTSASMCQRLNPSLGSNACTIGVGDLLFSQPQVPASIVNGSIIIFRPYPATPSYLVAHRVIKIIPAADSIYNQITFLTKGDANGVPDVWNQVNGGIPASQIVAVYQYTLPPPAMPSARSDTHAYSSVGNSQSKTFTVRVNATDNNGLATLQTALETITDRPPVLAIISLSPTTASTNQTITIVFSATDPDGTISSITVNWGDGSTPDTLPASATSDTHSYNSSGTFTITVTATDNSGSSSHVSSPPLTISATSPNNHHHHRHHEHEHHREHDSSNEKNEKAGSAPDRAEPETAQNEP